MLCGSINHTSGVRIEMYQSFRMPCEISLGKYAQRASVCRSVSPVDHCARVIGELSSSARGMFAQRAKSSIAPQWLRQATARAPVCCSSQTSTAPYASVDIQFIATAFTRGTAAEHELHTLSSLCVWLCQKATYTFCHGLFVYSHRLEKIDKNVNIT